MSDHYVIRQKYQILKAFDDCPVVLVEIQSEQTEWNGKICAISKNSGGFPYLEYAVEAGVFDDGKATFGITTQCLDAMEQFEEGYVEQQVNTENFYVSPKGYCHKEEIVQNNLENRIVQDTSPQNLSYLKYNKPIEAPPEETSQNEKSFVEENFGCLLSIFLCFVAFILWCLLTGW